MGSRLARIASYRVRLFIIALLVFLPSVHAFADEENFRKYGNLVNTVVYMWNSPFGLSNDEISEQIENSGVKTDQSALGKVIRGVLFEITATNTTTPKVPIASVGPLAESKWHAVKSINTKRYVALKALFILSQTANQYPKTGERLKYSIPKLYELKREALETADPATVAVASIWLAMEYAELNPIKAVVELEYALPHLSDFKQDYALETVLDKMLAHSWLADAYTRLNVLNKALVHQQFVIEKIEARDQLDAYSFTGIVLTLNQLGMFERALQRANEAQQAALNNQNESELLYSLWLKVSVYLYRNDEGDRAHIATALASLPPSPQQDLPTNVTPANEALAATYQAIHGTDAQFNTAVEAFSRYVSDKAEDLFYTKRVLLDKYNILKGIYKLRGNFEKAFYYQQQYEQLLVQSRFSLDNDENKLNDSPLERDIVISQLQKLAREKEQQNLRLETQKFQALALALCAALVAALLFGFYRSQRKRALRGERDDLTGAMTRNAMFKAIANPMASNTTSCMVLIDFDYFKQINDRYGHVAGDEVLSTFGNLVLSHLRKTDRFCRYGGEEFLLYLYETDEHAAQALLAKIKSAIEGHDTWTATDRKFSASFSAGVVEVTGESNVTKVIKVCDHLLYKAKSSGRGKIETTSLSAYFNQQSHAAPTFLR